ncbi:MAG TPA: helicase C-terminal domain-containing protein [Candidatus Nitrosotenuis sp.]|nr:helicase C-terminal domain-containing protein [Candidatus Nitrosotenuis sp.]
MILESFPAGFVPRSIQKELLTEIETHLKSGYKTIVLSAPTGVGKSPIAATLARHFGRSFIVTASKQLQDQYVSDFGFLKPVKGKSNFVCLQLIDHKKLDHKDEGLAFQLELTCEKGNCKTSTTKNGKKTFETCKYKPQIGQDQPQDMTQCHYYAQKYAALESDHSLWNYSSYFQLMKYSKETFAKYVDRPIAIFDEAHTIENQIMQFMGIDIYAKNIEDARIDLKSYNLTDIDMLKTLVETLGMYYKEETTKMAQSKVFQNDPDFIALSKTQSRYERFAKAYVELSANKDNFVISDPKTDINGDFKSISLVPLDISEYASEFFDVPVRLFMSATIEKRGFCENMGINPADVAYVDAPRSPFLPQNRQVEFLNVRKLSQASSQEDELSVIKKIDNLMDKHAEERGLILTSSEKRCHDIKNNLSEKNQKRIRICHSINEMRKTQSQLLVEHSENQNSVLLSSSLWEGVDLKDDLSRFQIIAKTPYPNLGDKRTRIKLKKYPLWYKSQTIMKILQGIGRSIRNENDWAKTYVLDSAAKELLDSWQFMVPKSFHDIIWPDSNLDLRYPSQTDKSRQKA